jgi:hypothetical protein
VLKLEISYRVRICWRILVSFRGFFFWRLYFCMVKYLNFHNSLFVSGGYLFNVNGKAPMWLTHTPYSLWHTLPTFCELYYFEVTTTGAKRHQIWLFFVWESECEVCRSQACALNTHFTKILMWEKRKESSSWWYKKEFQSCVCPWPPLPTPPSPPTTIRSH